MKEKYRQLCEQEKSIPIFLRDYWLDCVCDDWDVLLYEKNGRILGSLVYYIKEKRKIRYISMPKLTQFSGIWIDYSNFNKTEKRIAITNEVCEYFIDKLNHMKLSYYVQTFSPNFDNWLPFYWNDFQNEVQYSYVIKNDDINNTWDNMASTLKNEIRKAESCATIFECSDTKMLYKLMQKTYERQNKDLSINSKELEKINSALKKHHNVYAIGAKDNENNIHCICYFIYDDYKMYYLISGSDPVFRKSNFNSLLIWEGIKKANELGLDFDFEGSMKKDINSFMRKFGGELCPYFKISKVLTKNKIIKHFIRKKETGDKNVK